MDSNRVCTCIYREWFRGIFLGGDERSVMGLMAIGGLGAVWRSNQLVGCVWSPVYAELYQPSWTGLERSERQSYHRFSDNGSSFSESTSFRCFPRSAWLRSFSFPASWGGGVNEKVFVIPAASANRARMEAPRLVRS